MPLSLKSAILQNVVLPRSSQFFSSATATVQALYEIAGCFYQARKVKSSLGASEIIGLLISYSSRIRRNTQPRVFIRINVSFPDGQSALRIFIGKS